MGTSDEGIGDEKAKRKLLIPYEDVSDDLKSQYNWNLENRGMDDLGDIELVMLINKALPDATLEEKEAKFNELRNSND